MIGARIRVESSNAVYGDKNLMGKLPENFSAMFVSETKEDVNALADELLGPYLSSRGGFAFEQDAPHKWAQLVDVSYSKSRVECEEVLWAERLLGTVRLLGFALYYTNDEFYGFIIKTQEGEKVRFLAAQKNQDRFEALPEDFRFSTSFLVREIIQQYR